MAGNTPGRAGTRHGAVQNQTPHIVRHRAPCANCETPLYPSEFRYCQSCKAWLAIYSRTVEIARLLRAAAP